MQDEADLERSCIVSRRTGDPAGLIRFVRSPDGVATPDLRRRLPGRGAWVAADAAVMAQASAKHFSRAFKAATTVPDDLPALVEALLRRDALQALSLANKAGAVVAGFDQVAAALARNAVIAILHAREAAGGGRRKLAGGSGVAAISPFQSAEMDLALGRIHVIHAALTVGAVSDACLFRCRLLLAYRGEGGDGARVGEPNSQTGARAPAGSKAE